MIYAAFEHNADPYLYLPEKPLKVISVFDDLKYDRSDFDGLSPAMRRYVVKTLGSLGFKQKSGRVIAHAEHDIHCIMPKPSTLGASPFDVTRYTYKRERDFYVLTPTQTACIMVDRFPLQEAVDRIAALVSRQPINLFKLQDFLDARQAHQRFSEAIPYLKYKQRVAVEAQPLCHMKSLQW